jgi:hypothetical protein
MRFNVGRRRQCVKQMAEEANVKQVLLNIYNNIQGLFAIFNVGLLSHLLGHIVFVGQR